MDVIKVTIFLIYDSVNMRTSSCSSDDVERVDKDFLCVTLLNVTLMGVARK